jgi:hypothetical protein
MTERGTLSPDEHHPAALAATVWLTDYLLGRSGKIHVMLEEFSSMGASGNKLGEVCEETLRRLIVGDPIGDRYLLGLAWAIKEMDVKGKGT